jgi:hypothetical protein
VVPGDDLSCIFLRSNLWLVELDQGPIFQDSNRIEMSPLGRANVRFGAKSGHGDKFEQCPCSPQNRSSQVQLDRPPTAKVGAQSSKRLESGLPGMALPET